ncbi:MAG: hypothetical protein ACK4EY_01100 [Flavipsychrobacter sp.]
MITKDKLVIFKKYNGEVDNFGMLGKKSEHKFITDNDWYIISGLVQDIKLINNNLASPEYASNVFKTMKDLCDDESTYLILKDLAKTL